jgi:3-dehydroquinate synthase
MTRIEVAVEPRPYEVLIEPDLLARAGDCLRALVPQGTTCFVVTASPLRRKWGTKLLSSLTRAGWKAKVIDMPEGEPQKRMATVEALAEKLLTARADRNSLLIALGGGVVGDVTGFLASIYMRGIQVVQIPTTVVAQVDASIGGKTGVNLKRGKNLIGTFHQPRVVLVDPNVLSTLPDREFRSGLYEALKCGVIGNPDLFRRFEEKRDLILKRDPAQLQYLITESIRLKAHVVSADERETGLRRVLNFGHTIGHALEAETKYRRFLHGEAVAWGMVAATHIAAEIGKLPAALSSRIQDAVYGLGTLPEIHSSPAQVMRLLASDKKSTNGVVHFVLPRTIGEVEIVKDIPKTAIVRSIQKLRAHSQ